MGLRRINIFMCEPSCDDIALITLVGVIPMGPRTFKQLFVINN